MNRPQKTNPAALARPPKTAKSSSSGSEHIGGNQGRIGGNQGRGRSNSAKQPDEPSPWLKPEEEPNPCACASFVEYLRWMRAPDSAYKNDAKVQILQMAQDWSDYSEWLNTLTQRTKILAGEGNSFTATCPWRIRVGGHRGPESILLPAFDALGMPFIPSSTLRGIARAQAIRENLSEIPADAKATEKAWKEAEKKVVSIFGDLDAKPAERAGKVVFLDAYPLPTQKGGGLAMDMVNNIWKWTSDDRAPRYDNPNPSPFLSLKAVTFQIGLRPRSKSDKDLEILQQVQTWLKKGLQAGIGSQVNAGYGVLIPHKNRTEDCSEPDPPFFQLPFHLEGQLIHGSQKFRDLKRPYQPNKYGKLQADKVADAEPRSVAFKSMLRYWFRTLALAYMPPKQVQEQEAILFGAIQPKQWGWLRVQVLDGRVIQPEPQNEDDPCGQEAGTLALSLSPGVPAQFSDDTKDLFQCLTWLMFHLGGVGQGARRPRHFRRHRKKAFRLFYRGSTLMPDRSQANWDLPAAPEEFSQRFQQQLQRFYRILSQIAQPTFKQNKRVRPGTVIQEQGEDAVDKNCQIVLCSGEPENGKPYALAVLHRDRFKVDKRDRDGKPYRDYDGDLCGNVKGKKVRPSPVWIADLDSYQVVTVFGAKHKPRQQYLEVLRQDAEDFYTIWPLGGTQKP